MTREELFAKWISEYPESELVKLLGGADFPGDPGYTGYALINKGITRIRSVWSDYYADHKDLISDGVTGNIHDSES